MSARNPGDRDQYAAFEAYRAAACSEADALFDDRALEVQRHKILARLAHLGQSAKVIRFPRTSSGELQATGVNRRWISVAAAAGLIIGLLGGQLVHILPQQSRGLAPMATSIAPSAPSRAPFTPVSFAADDGLLGEIELVMQARTANELRALDEYTLADQH
jgi:hypothetical protein